MHSLWTPPKRHAKNTKKITYTDQVVQSRYASDVVFARPSTMSRDTSVKMIAVFTRKERGRTEGVMVTLIATEAVT